MTDLFTALEDNGRSRDVLESGQVLLNQYSEMVVPGLFFNSVVTKAGRTLLRVIPVSPIEEIDDIPLLISEPIPPVTFVQPLTQPSTQSSPILTKSTALDIEFKPTPVEQKPNPLGSSSEEIIEYSNGAIFSVEDLGSIPSNILGRNRSFSTNRNITILRSRTSLTEDQHDIEPDQVQKEVQSINDNVALILNRIRAEIK